MGGRRAAPGEGAAACVTIFVKSCTKAEQSLFVALGPFGASFESSNGLQVVKRPLFVEGTRRKLGARSRVRGRRIDQGGHEKGNANDGKGQQPERCEAQLLRL